MCGIVGLVGDQEGEWIARMNGAIVHRGPDDAGTFREDDCSLAMRRLSIVDRSGGHQPMTSADGRYVLVYNGEIFNAAPLRRELEQQGVRFRTDHSDTEVLLELLAREGESALQKLNGMFAFALLDRTARTLFLARDRFGIKPLYYARQGRRFALASELKALLTLPWLDRAPDLQSLFHYFSVHYIPGAASAYVGVQRLLPGAWLRLDLRSGQMVTQRWWTPQFGAAAAESPRQLTERLSEKLAEAVDRWAISDEPMGCLLSGGLDSSAVVSLLAKRGHSLKTFTVGFSGPGEEAWDELHLARRIAQRWGTEHREIILDPESLLDDLADMVWALDEPYGGGLPSWSVFKAMGAEIKVAMTGTGGDELFGNYNKYLFLEGRLRGRVPGMARRSAGRAQFERDFFARFYYAGDEDKRHSMLTDRFASATDTSQMLWESFDAGGVSRALRDRVVATDLATQLPDEFLLMTDRFSMAHSIEARTPFLDHELAHDVYMIKAARRLSPNRYKPLLRDIVANLLPPELLTAPKRGFVIPLNLWLRGRLAPLLKRLLAPRRLAEQGLVRSDFLERYGLPHIAGVRDHTQRLWNMLMFQLWWEIFIVGTPLEAVRTEVRGAA